MKGSGGGIMVGENDIGTLPVVPTAIHLRTGQLPNIGLVFASWQVILKKLCVSSHCIDRVESTPVRLNMIPTLSPSHQTLQSDPITVLLVYNYG